MIHKYLKDLVENNNRIIIPDFGAFMVQNTPEGKQISFNDFLKFNDGLLVNQVIKSEKISKSEASEHIKNFIKEIEAAFAKGESYEVKEVGFLVKDDHGNIKFESQLTTKEEKTEVTPTDPKPTIVLDEKAEDKTTEKAVDSETTSMEKKAETVDAKEAKTETSKKEVLKEKESLEPKPEPKQEIKPSAVKKEPTKIPKTPKNITKTPPPTEAKKTPPPTTPKSGGKNTLIIIIAVAVIVISTSVFAAFKFNWFGIGQEPEPVVEVIPMEDPIIDTTPEVVADTIKAIEEPEVVEEEPAPEADPNVKRYYIVAGSFKVADNAQNYYEQLKTEGYNSEIIIRNNGYHTVSYKTLYEWNEALAEWRNMREVNNQTWILVK